ncbi:MAG TPA: hypothetical protein VK186_22415, partial [Candidatus Deferrimicrobium sp.]|nr:hypothetical protein [Candidatus Deferrimicrobium sp.]
MKPKSLDEAVNYMLEKAGQEGIETVWDRSVQQEPRCGFGELGICCRNCYMGPCRIDPFGVGPQKGVCGATAEIIVARNFGRMIAAGAAAHSDHGRDVANALLLAATHPGAGYTIKDVAKLRKVAQFLGVTTEGKSKEDIGREVAEKALENFGRQEGEVPFISLAPEARQAIWRKLDI